MGLYSYFPAWSRLVRSYPRPLQGMTARFHKSWADFGGLKTVPQLDYEAATIVAAGGVVNIGDQLHPRGTLDRGAYQVIGETFRRVEAIEPFCRGAKPLADVAVLLLPQPDDEKMKYGDEILLKMTPGFEGAASLLAALKVQWDGQTPDRDELQNYKVVIIPDSGAIDENLRDKLDKFAANAAARFCSRMRRD